jgi:RNase_H superfamily
MLRITDIAEHTVVFYDIETTGVYAPYCELIMIGYQLGINGKPELVDPDSKSSCDRFRNLVNDPNVMKVSYNGINFDDIVLWRYGFYVEPRGRHDMYLALKTIHPTFPSYSLKFVNAWIDRGDWRSLFHDSEQLLLGWLKHNYEENIHDAPIEMIARYCMHDVTETVNVFRAVWEKVQEDQHWRPYVRLEIAMGEPLHEMMLLGRELVDIEDVRSRLIEEGKRLAHWTKHVDELSEGRIKNPISSQQATRYMQEEYGIDFDITEAGHLVGRKSDWLKLMEEDVDHTNKSEIAKGIYEARDASKVMGYLRSYLRASRFERRWQRKLSTNGEREDGKFSPINFAIGNDKRRVWRNKRSEVSRDNSKDNSLVWLPKSYGLSAARTRRFRSSSRFSYRAIVNGAIKEFTLGINWQNQNKRTKVVQLVPKGWLGFWLDSTQIENVVHIWASNDEVRRAAYEADPYWNEYVWLSNMILGEDLDRDKLEKRFSPTNPSWSVYKQYKTIKLALNFGMGPDKFSKETGLKIKDAIKEFNKVHKACPAIRRLQGMVRETIKENGFIEDPFGHIYSGNIDEAYKIVAYLVQGCGTGSVPKAMTIANYKTIHKYDTKEPMYDPYIKHPYTGRCSYGVLCGTTHDECAGRISLGLSEHRIVEIIRELLYNMEQKFSNLFDDIPLRAKLAVSISNAAAQEEIDHRKENFEERLITYIREGKKKI